VKDAVQKATGPEVLIHFSVRDTGIGINQDNISRLFQSFSQVPTLHLLLSAEAAMTSCISALVLPQSYEYSLPRELVVSKLSGLYSHRAEECDQGKAVPWSIHSTSAAMCLSQALSIE